MALKATVHRATLTISDLDRDVYGDFALTLARHPSETDERMMVRLLAFALEADERLAFGAGLSTDDEPDLWRHALDGRIERWIEVGLPEPKRLKQALGRAGTARVIAYGARRVEPWWARHGREFAALGEALEVLQLDDESCAALAAFADRTMRLTATVQDAGVWLTDPAGTLVEVRLDRLHPTQDGSRRRPGENDGE